jgi:hypothetical protein
MCGCGNEKSREQYGEKGKKAPLMVSGAGGNNKYDSERAIQYNV